MIEIAYTEGNLYYLYIFAIILIIIFLIMGYSMEHPTFMVMAGVLCCVMALALNSSTFNNLSDPFVKNGVVMVFAGMGFYYILMPSIAALERWNEQ